MAVSWLVETQGKRQKIAGAYGAIQQQPAPNGRKPTAKCKDIKGLRVKKLVLGEATDAEPHTAVPAARGADEAVGRAAEPGVEAPRTAAQQPPFVFFCLLIKPGTSIRWSPLVAVMPMIFAPLIHIAMHVVEAPGIGREAGHLDGLVAEAALGAICIAIIAIVIGQLRADRFAAIKRRGAAGAAGVFPLRLTRQSVGASRALAEPGAKLDRIKPTHPLHRSLVGI